MPPLSPTKPYGFEVEAVGIPTSSQRRIIVNRDENKYEQGYDSDGEIGPFLDAVAGQKIMDVEEEDKGLPLSMGGDGSEAVDAPTGRPDWFMEDSEMNAIKVDKLKGELKRRGLVPKGKKGGLITMLKEAVAASKPICVEANVDAGALGGFPVTASWKFLEPNADVVENPINDFDFRAPTLAEHENPTTPKHNYDEVFDRPVFTGRDREGGYD